MSASAEIVLVSPELASEWLEANNGNRSIRPHRVKQYAADMSSGRWKLNGDSVKFNEDGKLFDGQHRLLACVSSGVSFETVVMTAVSDDSHPTIDAGAKRTMADHLKWMGVPGAASTASTLSLLWRYSNGELTGSGYGTHQQLLDILDQTPQIQRATTLGKRIGETVKIPASILAALYCLAFELHGEEMTERWFYHLESGTGYTKGDPALALRSYALQAHASKNLRPRQADWLAVLIKSFNAWVAGRQIRTLMWRSVGPAAEKFPALAPAESSEEAA